MNVFQIPQGYRSAFWLVLISVSAVASNARLAPSDSRLEAQSWSSEAKLHHLPRSLDGVLTVTSDGVEFRPEKDAAMHWGFGDIRTVDLSTPKHLSLVTYENNRWHMPGDRPFEFRLDKQMPPEVAADLVRQVGRPAINGDPARNVNSVAVIPARHKTRMGGSNGLLRFTDSGIDYISKADDSRSWRWNDIETLAHPEPYRLRVGGYLEIFDFELKEPLAGDLFDRLWDHIYAQPAAEGAPNPKTF